MDGRRPLLPLGVHWPGAARAHQSPAFTAVKGIVPARRQAGCPGVVGPGDRTLSNVAGRAPGLRRALYDQKSPAELNIAKILYSNSTLKHARCSGGFPLAM